MKYIYIDKVTSQIRMENQEPLDVPQFIEKKIDDKEDLSGQICLFKDGKIKKTSIVKDKKKISDMVDKVKTIDDLKLIIKDLL